MDIENLKEKIAALTGISNSDADLAFKLCVDKVSELLDYDEALKIPGLGIFNLKREPLTRQERKGNLEDATSSKQTLIFSPEKDVNSSESDSMYLTIDLDEESGNSTDFDDSIFSLGVDKPLVPVASTKVDLEGDLEIIQNLEEKISVLVSNSEKIPDFDLWEDYSVQAPDTTEAEESDPFSVLDDELKDLISQTEIGEDVPNKIEDVPSEVKIDEPVTTFDELQDSLNDIEADDLESSGIENITFSDDLNLDELEEKIDDVEATENQEAEPVSEKAESSAEEEEINWNWGDELKDELSIEDTVEEEPVDDSSTELDPELFDKISDETESTIEDSIEIEDEINIDFDDDTLNDESESAESGEDEAEQESEEPVPDSATASKTVEYSSDSEPEKPEKESAKKFTFSLPVYIALGAAAIIGLFGIYYLFFTGSEPVETLPEGEQHTEQVDEDIITTQLSTKLEPQDNPIVKVKSDEQIDDIIEDVPENAHESVLDSNETAYTAVPNKIAEKHDVKTEEPKAPVLTSSNYRKIENEKRISNLVFFDGENYNVQVSSWKTKRQAEAHVKKLITKGHAAFIVEAYLSALGGTWYRVRIGDFSTAKEAEQYRLNNKL